MGHEAMNHGLIHEHDPSLVIVAVLVCVTGGWATSRFFKRMTDVGDRQRYSWLFLTSLASGVTIWCTHFIAMLGYHTGVRASFDGVLTVTSLVVAVMGSAIGFLVAGGVRASRVRPALGGVVVGLSITSMHYVGMSAFRMQGSISWDRPLVALSVGFAVLLSAAAMQAARSPLRHAANLMWGLFVLSVLLLHFTGMCAMSVMATSPGGEVSGSQSLYVLAVAIAGMSFVTIGAGAAGYFIDDRTRAAAMERFRHLAMHDVLTDLPNRASFNERLDAEIERARRTGSGLALIVIDVDNFKEINDLHGHMAGDEVLSVLGRRMAELTKGKDGEFIARIGGDEFVATFRLGDGRDVSVFLTKLRQVLSSAVHLVADDIVPRASIGVAVFPDDATDAETLVNNADLAMYRAKNDTRHDTGFYDAAIDERTRVRRGLAADLREAVDRGELFLEYQVLVAVQTGEARGYEALLRWRHPQLGFVPPDRFIPLAEESGLIVPIGEWVLRTACAEAATWHDRYRVAVNVSAIQLADPELVHIVRAALEESGLPATRLELEVTETAVFTDRVRARQALEAIKELGVGIALDDFGVGYSSLDALRSFPFDRIKIDRSFFSGSGTPDQTLEILQAVLSLGKTFGMSVLAEGIETDEQLGLLSQTGCEEAQGFLFGRPAPPDQITGLGRRPMPPAPAA